MDTEPKKEQPTEQEQWEQNCDKAIETIKESNIIVHNDDEDDEVIELN